MNINSLLVGYFLGSHNRTLNNQPATPQPTTTSHGGSFQNISAIRASSAKPKSCGLKMALAGINAAVVGLLLAALYQPVWTSAIVQAQDFVLALVALVALMFWKLPPWLVVIGCGVTGWLL